MRTLGLFVLVGFVALSAAAPASAQPRVPDSGMVGVGASFGASPPTDGRLDNGLAVAANAEGYLTPRVSIRGQIGGTWQDFTGQRFSGTLKPLYFTGNVVYNWEGGALHPFVTGGVGVYRFAYEESGINGSDTTAGFDVGGGLEYFFTRHSTFTGEALFHRVGSVTTALAPFGSGDASFWTFTIGLKRYF